MERVDPALSRVAYLMVVQRGDHDRFGFLRSTFGDRPVEVMWDRRLSDRRTTSDGPDVDRRASDRRRTPPTSWNNLGFLVARSARVQEEAAGQEPSLRNNPPGAVSN
jgi:hypothetical protein